MNSEPASPTASTSNLVRRRLQDLRRTLKRGAGRDVRHMHLLMEHFFKNSPDAFVLSYRPEELLAILSSAYRVMLLTRGSTLAVSVFNPEELRHGFSSDRTVIQISAPDGPFYVISVRERLRSMRHAIAHLIHPILPVDWDARGRLKSIGGMHLESRQSLIHIEIDRVEDPAELRQIDRAVREVFTDIRLVAGDFEKMRTALSVVLRELEKTPKEGKTAEDHKQLYKFMHWLDNGNFVFLGYREYDILTKVGVKFCAVRRGSGLGILSRESQSRFYRPQPLFRIPAGQRRELLSPTPYVIAQTNRPSPIYRRERMISVSVKRFDPRGRVIGARLWLGLFTNRVEGLPATEIPILQEKFERVVAAEGAQVHSHDYREMYGIFSSYPKDFLFSARVEDLRREIRVAMAAQTEKDFKATFRPSSLGNEISVVVVMSKDKFSREVRLKIEERLKLRLDARNIDYSLSMGAEGGEFARLYFSCITSRKVPNQGTFADLEKELAELAKTWLDRLQDELVRRRGPKDGLRLFKLYGAAFSVEFQAHTPPGGAVFDIDKLESLYTAAAQISRQSETSPGPLQIDLFNSRADTDCSRLKLYHLHAKLPLSDIMPILTDHGLRVVDEVSNSVRVTGRPLAFIHTFRIQKNEKPLEVDALAKPMSHSVLGSIRREIDCDPLASLILLANLSPREVDLMRLYRNYLHQIVPVHTLRSIDSTLVRNPAGARLLADLFNARFDPAVGPVNSANRRHRVSRARTALEDFIEGVEDMLEDRILRLMANAIEATVRTNYYETPARRTLGIKIRSAEIHTMPKPVPLFEIFVCAADFEGIHLRGGRIARGGIRHSDRRDDFRTEILGLMKTQMVKNAIIVPVGAKGGFVVKTVVPRERVSEMVVKCYRSFIRTLLDLTDNEIERRIVHPVGCVIYDEPDPYLVVAADKGTASFSDLANRISCERGFWLGDAFASGGTNGYDHKVLGITARGAWECVRHHLALMSGGKRGMTQEKGPILLTCVGIGDMSGDVFGNGMLAGSRIRVGRRRVVILLQAAFNHQYIFLDPDPDPQKSDAERRRLFRLPRSSWSDYDPKSISPGGGVFLRSSKKIVLSRRAAQMLDIPSQTASGEEVVRAILKMKVDLLYNGGIGAYVKSSDERHPDVGDPANDRVRINASELGCRIVAEGGNVGLTQAARIEFAKAGGRINTDAVDNSAGVDLSDHEVNLKILLEALRVRPDRRPKILRRLTDPVRRSVLRDNALQSRILSIEEYRSAREINAYPHLMEILAGTTGLSRDIEGLPADKELAERSKHGAGLVRPELAVLLAHVKMTIDQSLMESSGVSGSLVSDPILWKFLYDYFPAEIVKKFGRKILKHGLAEQITATVAANRFVNRAGLTRGFRISEQCAVSLRDAIRSYVVAETLVWAESLRDQIEVMIAAPSDPVSPGRPPAAVVAWDVLEEGIEGMARWILKEYEGKDLSDALSDFRAMPDLISRLVQLLSETEKKRFKDSVENLRSMGVRPDLARHLVEIKMAVYLLELQVAGAKLRTLR